ncbi:MAG: solute-binding protein [Firmicutes bacterium]|nr:solute-binding protein [Bacillota bacterium]
MSGRLRKLVLVMMVVLMAASGALAAERLILATTTSTENSGLLAHLLPPFEEKYNVRVDVIAVGTGKALELGRNGDADVVLVHDRVSEDAFVEGGYGVNRRDVMYNDYIILGPDSDPAGVRNAKSAVEAFSLIAKAKTPFVSRGDDSGTHKKELAIWAEANIEPAAPWYMPVGQGMGPCINIAGEQNGYVLSDRGTYISYKTKTDLVIVFEGDPILFNPYGVIAVNPELHPHVNYEQAMNFIEFLTSDEGRALIESYKMEGDQLFYLYR